MSKIRSICVTRPPWNKPWIAEWMWINPTNIKVSYHSSGITPLRWRHNDHAGISNHQPHGCLLNRLFRRKSKKTSKLRVTGLCAGNSPGTGEFPAQMASYAENVSIWWRHHASTEKHEVSILVSTLSLGLCFIISTPSDFTGLSSDWPVARKDNNVVLFLWKKNTLKSLACR